MIQTFLDASAAANLQENNHQLFRYIYFNILKKCIMKYKCTMQVFREILFSIKN